MRMKQRPKPGSISEGTMLLRDTVPAMLDEVERIEGNSRFVRFCKRTIRDIIIDWDNPNDRESPIFLSDDLWERLEGYGMDYLTFSAHPDDPASIGWWVDDEAIVEDRSTGELPSGDQLPVANLSAPRHFLVINDHGNMTLFRRASNRWIECWGIV